MRRKGKKVEQINEMLFDDESVGYEMTHTEDESLR